MALLVHRTPSVGALTNKILAINPDLGIVEIASIIRECSTSFGFGNEEFASAERVDENRVLELAKATLKRA